VLLQNNLNVDKIGPKQKRNQEVFIITILKKKKRKVRKLIKIKEKLIIKSQETFTQIGKKNGK
jgi:hypothetical protein